MRKRKNRENWHQRSGRPGVVAIVAVGLAVLGPAAGAAAQDAVCAEPGATLTAAEEQRVREQLTLAYENLNRSEVGEASDRLAAALAIDPCRAEVQAQLGYALAELTRSGEALERFEEARRLGYADDRVTLQMAYLHDRSGNQLGARRLFAEAAGGEDAEVAEQAEAELIVRGAAPGLWLTDVYVAPLYQSRFDNLVTTALLRSGPILTAPRLAQPYGFLRANRDTRSGSGQTQIFSENAVIVGGGVRLRPFGGTMAAYVEAGPGYRLVRGEGEESWFGSAQAGIYDFRILGIPRDEAGPSVTGLFAEIYYDASYYSRFGDNGIAYLQLRPGVRRTGGSAGTLDLYLPLLGVADTRGLYFNNLVEVGGGVRWTPPGLGGAAFSAEYLRGHYLREPDAGGRGYGDLRISLTTPFFLARGREGR